MSSIEITNKNKFSPFCSRSNTPVPGEPLERYGVRSLNDTPIGSPRPDSNASFADLGERLVSPPSDGFSRIHVGSDGERLSGFSSALVSSQSLSRILSPEAPQSGVCSSGKSPSDSSSWRSSTPVLPDSKAVVKPDLATGGGTQGGGVDWWKVLKIAGGVAVVVVSVLAALGGGSDSPSSDDSKSDD